MPERARCPPRPVSAGEPAGSARAIERGPNVTGCLLPRRDGFGAEHVALIAVADMEASSCWPSPSAAHPVTQRCCLPGYVRGAGGGFSDPHRLVGASGPPAAPALHWHRAHPVHPAGAPFSERVRPRRWPDPQIYTVLSSPAEANRAYSAVVRFEVVTPEPGVVDAWSMRRLPFEPSGWLVDFRSQLATACRRLIADQDQVLHAIYSSAVHELGDIENVLTYNLGTGAIRRAATYGLILERSFVAERDFRHHYQGES